MQAEKIYKNALSFIFERPDKDVDFKYFFLNFLNTVLVEALPYENVIREASGAEKLLNAPEIADISEEVPYNEEICRVALPYGVASFYFQDEGDDYKSQDYRARYINALTSACQKAFTISEIEDVYPIPDIF